MYSPGRTDLAIESALRAGQKHTEIPGAEMREYTLAGCPVTQVRIFSPAGAEKIGKPEGLYITFRPETFLRREPEGFSRGAFALARLLHKTLNISSSSPVLVAGLGNRAITPDAVGPCTLDNLMVTRHLYSHAPEHFSGLRPVSAVAPGVLGTSGIESAAMIAALVRETRPAAVIAVDALAAAEPNHLCRTVQIADTGIVPGSGVGNARAALNRDTLGVPVIAIGVPTVTDAPGAEGMFVTPRDIDKSVRDLGKLLGYGLNLALHNGLSIEDIDMFLS